ncbi:hypothetical protein BST61_g10857 [Cercospora zeina]
MDTRILPVDVRKIGSVRAKSVPDDVLDELDFQIDDASVDAQYLQQAANDLKTSDVPVAFPTETVYGLGADATRSDAVKGIYKAKQRPSDNPLIVHFHSLQQLRSLLHGHASSEANGVGEDPIPAIYYSLISRFWPGPLTIILPNPNNSPLAPEVTAGLRTFGARVPRHPLALALLSLADVPVAAPSANASTKPSPTAAEHVANDLDGRISTILDGGPCDVGVESTVVDGISQQPPVVLRPGGVSLEQIRSCPGWENTQIGYKDVSEKGTQPRAPGMKYRHYSPKAAVVLFEAGKTPPSDDELKAQIGAQARIGLVRTRLWQVDVSSNTGLVNESGSKDNDFEPPLTDYGVGFAGMLKALQENNWLKVAPKKHRVSIAGSPVEVLDVALGANTGSIARGIFSALRDLDREDVDAIFVEGIDDNEGSLAAAVMNRLRKAAEVRVSSEFPRLVPETC